MFLLTACVVLVGCKKEEEEPCVEVATSVPPSEVTTLRAYITGNGITATEDPRGFFYRIETQGTGTKPNQCSDIVIDYVGKLTTGGTFDSRANMSFSLRQLIAGWRVGLPLINTGGRIVLYLPPSLGYGASASGTIPPNSILIFTIDLKAVE